MGVAAWIWAVSDWRAALPQAILYLLLLINTYFSVRFFSAISPQTATQHVVDLVLVVAYAALAFTMERVAEFLFFGLCLFLVATMKYALLLDVIPHVQTLRRKIAIDTLGACLCTTSLGGALVGYGPESAWALALVYTAITVSILWVRPIYYI